MEARAEIATKAELAASTEPERLRHSRSTPPSVVGVVDPC